MQLEHWQPDIQTKSKPIIRKANGSGGKHTTSRRPRSLRCPHARTSESCRTLSLFIMMCSTRAHFQRLAAHASAAQLTLCGQRQRSLRPCSCDGQRHHLAELFADCSLQPTTSKHGGFIVHKALHVLASMQYSRRVMCLATRPQSSTGIKGKPSDLRAILIGAARWPSL